MTEKNYIRYFSDLHLEFIKPNKIDEFISQISPGMDQICILAGDIGNPYQQNYDIFMKFISKNFKKAFVIPGNHEYYNKKKRLQQTNEFMKIYFEKFNNISFLNNSYEVYENICYIGTILWSKIINPCYEINDIYQIPHFTCSEYNSLNTICIEFLENTLENNSNCIVITHHVPSYSLIDKKYKTELMEPYNQWFYSDMDTLIKNKGNKIKAWFYGHTHTPSNTIMNEIPFLCNPIGYPSENENINFDLSTII
jgi:predicted MPP superfamily phosphohydrolase